MSDAIEGVRKARDDCGGGVRRRKGLHLLEAALNEEFEDDDGIADDDTCAVGKILDLEVASSREHTMLALNEGHEDTKTLFCRFRNDAGAVPYRVNGFVNKDIVSILRVVLRLT